MCRKCSGFMRSTYAYKEVTLDGDVIEKVAKFSHLGDDLSSGGGGGQEAVNARTRCGWKTFKEIASILRKRAVSLKLKKSINKSCVRRFLCYGAECWASKKQDKRKLQTTGR